MSDIKTISSIELFCGAGGLAMGLQAAGFSHQALFEWDYDSCFNINSNISLKNPLIKDWKVFQKDIRTVSFDHFAGLISAVSGGPPCQPFSLGGKGMAHFDNRDMFPDAVRAVREVRPQVFIFENVKGLLRKAFQKYYEYIILQLSYPSITRSYNETWEIHYNHLKQHHSATKGNNCEYNVTYKLFNTADYGVPQTRYRVIIVGFRADLKSDWAFPNPTHSKESLLYSKWVSGDYWENHSLQKPKEIPLKKAALRKIQEQLEETDTPLKPWLTVRDAISDLPDPRDTAAQEIYNHEYRPGAKPYKGHSGSHLDAPSKTIKAGAHGVPGGENTIIMDDGELRYYTVRESARIQTFPDSYRFFTSWTESMRQIGNAVPVKFAEQIGLSINNYMKGLAHDNR